jgi:hypothetical protein
MNDVNRSRHPKLYVSAAIDAFFVRFNSFATLPRSLPLVCDGQDCGRYRNYNNRNQQMICNHLTKLSNFLTNPYSSYFIVI